MESKRNRERLDSPQRTVSTFKMMLWCLCFALFGVSCAKEAEPPPAPPPEPEPLEHVVMYEGENLGLIAGWYTGQSSNWELVLDANPGLVPERINLGDIILIPPDLVVEEKPLPEHVVKAAMNRVGSGKQQELDDVTMENFTVPDAVQQTPQETAEESAEKMSEDEFAETEGDQPAPDTEGVAVEVSIPKDEKRTLPTKESTSRELLSQEDVPKRIVETKPDEKGIETEKEEAVESRETLTDEERERERLLDELLSQ